MSAIDFTPTAYTVTRPGDGQPTRYDVEHHRLSVERAQAAFTTLAGVYPNLARFVVPDHFVQKYCQAYDRSLWSGSSDVDARAVFTQLAEVGACLMKFS